MSVRDVSAGTMVDGRYRIKSRIGSGGMADVYCAVDEQLGRDIALKLLHRRFAEDQEFVERFRREASSAAGLQHPNVVGVFDRGEWDGTSYIAMEHLQGRTLKQLIVQEAPLDPVRAIDLTVQILRAARFAHKRGVIHRDLKPHNVIVDEEDRAKVTDFGIARAGASDMTETGSIMGTAQYLSPEQAQGHATDERSDLYAVGVILYELLTGRLPFDGESAVTIALKQVSQTPVAPRALHAAIPPALEAIVLRALEKDPARRPQDADAFIASLEAVRAGLVAGGGGQPTTAFAPVAPMPPAPAAARSAYVAASPPAYAPPAYAEPVEELPPRRWPWVVLLLLLLAGAAIAAYALTRPHQVRVPNVVGKPEAGAKALLRNRGLDVRVERSHRSDVPNGIVFREDPQPQAEVDKGSAVTLQISSGPGARAVPDVTGKGRHAAAAALRRAGFSPRESVQSSDTVPHDHVISTAPAPGDVAPVGSVVTVVVSSGPEKVDLPDVTNQPVDAARGTLVGLGLKVTTTERDSSSDPGTVLEQSPQAGAKVPKGSTVALVVAKAGTVAVPKVQGRDESDAVNALVDAGLVPRTVRQDVSSPAQDGVVLSARPAAGRKVKKGSTVVITVGRFNPALNPDPGTTTGTSTTAPPPGATGTPGGP